MTGKNIQDALAFEKEIEDWDSYISAKCGWFSSKSFAAEKSGDIALAEQLSARRKLWASVKSKGYYHAKDTALGKAALAYIKARRKALDEDLPIPSEPEYESFIAPEKGRS